MDDIILEAQLDDDTKMSISPIADATYSEYVDDDALGGADGYFITRSSTRLGRPPFEVLAKVNTLEAADALFSMIVAAARGNAISRTI